MKHVDHTHPYTNEPFGKNYYDGGTVMTDGGHESASDTLADVDHESPNAGASRSFERGSEGRNTIV